MANPHWEERFTEEVPIRDDWSPLGEYGQHGEFEGHLLQDDPSSYTSDWQNYPEMGGVPPSLSNPFRYPEVNEEVSISDLGFQGRPPYPEQYWRKPYPYDDGIGRPPMGSLVNQPRTGEPWTPGSHRRHILNNPNNPIPVATHPYGLDDEGNWQSSPKQKHDIGAQEGLEKAIRDMFVERQRKSQGRPPYPEEYWNKPYPYDDEVFEDEGSWYDKIPWWLIPGLKIPRGIETLLENR